MRRLYITVGDACSGGEMGHEHSCPFFTWDHAQCGHPEASGDLRRLYIDVGDARPSACPLRGSEVVVRLNEDR